MDIRLQAKLLRVIQEGEVDRIGGRRPIPVDVRIIATTNQNLADCVRQGAFREDLFYRLNVVNLTLPTLRDRIGDVRLLAQHFTKDLASISDAALALLESHGWPGNIRELENVMERATITALNGLITEKEIHIDRRDAQLGAANALAMDRGEERAPWVPGKTLDDIERNVILQALDYHKGNRTHTARALGISIRTLRNKLADYRRLGIRV